MKSLVAVFIVFLLSLTCPLFAYAFLDSDFEYSYRDPCAAAESEYIITKKNVECRQESSVTYWKPIIGNATESTTEPGVMVYHFNFLRPIRDGWLTINTWSYHWWYSQGHTYVYYSTDGTDWTKLAEAPPPAEGTANSGSWNGSLPSDFNSLYDIYFKIELYSFGERADSGGAFTNTAQHSRYQAGFISDSFYLGVRYEDWIDSIKSITTTYESKDGKEMTTEDLIPGKPSVVVTNLKNERPGSEVSTYLTIGISLGGAPPVTIGQSGPHVIKSTSPNEATTTIITPEDTNGYIVCELVWVLKEVGTDKILDIYKLKWNIKNDFMEQIYPNSIYPVLLLLLLSDYD